MDIYVGRSQSSIQYSIVIISHGGETRLEQSGGARGRCFNDETLEKGLRSVPVFVDVEEDG